MRRYAGDFPAPPAESSPYASAMTSTSGFVEPRPEEPQARGRADRRGARQATRPRVTRPRVSSNQRAPRRGSRSLSCFAISAVSSSASRRSAADRCPALKLKGLGRDRRERIVAGRELRNPPLRPSPHCSLSAQGATCLRKGGAVALHAGRARRPRRYVATCAPPAAGRAGRFPTGPRPPCGVLVNRAAAAKVWAERRAGELLAAMRSMAATGEAPNFQSRQR